MPSITTQLKRVLARIFPYLTSSARHYFKTKREGHITSLNSVWGFKFYGPEAMQNGNFESEEIKQISRFFIHVDTFIDIGANLGLYTCIARSRELNVISVEPEYFNVQTLLRNLQENKWGDVTVLPIGAGSTCDIARLYGGGTGASLVQGWSGGASTHQNIPVNTIDSIASLAPKDHRLAIKLDVEGFEYEALSGATKTLTRDIKPIWFIEIDFNEHHPNGINPNFSSIFSIFWDNGYKCFTCDKSFNEVTQSAVESWIKSTTRSFGGHNYIFVENGFDLGTLKADNSI